MGRTLLVAGAVLPLALLGACAGPLNHESAVGDPDNGGFELATINPEMALARAQGVGGLYDGSPWDRPDGSIKGIERDNWREVDYTVPIDGTSHQPIYSVHPDYANALARERGLYPDTTTCLDLRGENTNNMQALEGIAAPFYSGLDIALWIPRAVLVPPGSTVQSPGRAYERSPRLHEAWQTTRPAPPVVEPGPTPAPTAQEPYPEPAHYEQPAPTPPPPPPQEPAPK